MNHRTGQKAHPNQLVGRPKSGRGIPSASIPFGLVPLYLLGKYTLRHDKAAFDSLNKALAEVAKRHGIEIEQFVHGKEDAEKAE